MGIKLHYGPSGFRSVSVDLDSTAFSDIKNAQENAKAILAFLNAMGVQGIGQSFSVEENENSADTAKDIKKRPHNNSKHHYYANTELANDILKAGGLRYLHGVQNLDGTRYYFFDKVPFVQQFVEKGRVKANASASFRKKTVKKNAEGKLEAEKANDTSMKLKAKKCVMVDHPISVVDDVLLEAVNTTAKAGCSSAHPETSAGDDV